MNTCPSPSETITSTSEQLSEKQLREIYDNEEVERFLRLFAKVRTPSVSSQQTHLNITQYVTEVRAPGAARNTSEVEVQKGLENEYLAPPDTSSAASSITPKYSASDKHHEEDLSFSDEVAKVSQWKVTHAFKSLH